MFDASLKTLPGQSSPQKKKRIERGSHQKRKSQSGSNRTRCTQRSTPALRFFSGGVKRTATVSSKPLREAGRIAQAPASLAFDLPRREAKPRYEKGVAVGSDVVFQQSLVVDRDISQD